MNSTILGKTGQVATLAVADVRGTYFDSLDVDSA